jgi:hypothetical protein
VLAQMVLGVVMSQIHIYGWVQVLHVGLAAILIAGNFYWILSLGKTEDFNKSKQSSAGNHFANGLTKKP